MVIDISKGCGELGFYGLTQYDYGQRLYISGMEIPDHTEVHFCQSGKAVTQYMENNSVLVPDYMLKYARKINTYLYHVDIKSGKTIKHIVLYITARDRPGDYVEPEEPTYSRLLPIGGESGQVPVMQGENRSSAWGYRADGIYYDGEYMRLLSGDVPIGERVRIVSDGREIEMKNDGMNICWRYTNSNDWVVLVSLESLKGSPGITPEFEIRDGHLIVKYEK